jgi:hypothetical protein
MMGRTLKSALRGLWIRKWRNTPERASLEMLYDVRTHESLERVLGRWDQSRPDDSSARFSSSPRADETAELVKR